MLFILMTGTWFCLQRLITLFCSDTIMYVIMDTQLRTKKNSTHLINSKVQNN
jgi:hypothetical protein